MATLRSRHGCPWDRKQTHETLRPFLLEEAYELLETIDRREYVDLPGELGDVLFQCVFHAQIGAEAGRFDIVDAVESITDKLVRRHPHVFTASGRALGARKKGASKHGRLRSPGAVVTQWEAIKAREQDTKGQKKRILAGVPASLPALLGAHEIGTRVAAVGFDWDKTEDVIDKVDEEVRELREALGQSRARASEELGDLLFSIAKYFRFCNLVCVNKKNHKEKNKYPKYFPAKDHDTFVKLKFEKSAFDLRPPVSVGKYRGRQIIVMDFYLFFR